jgi:biotin-(acetyl-CoA carboxylase) ligase
LGLNVNVDHDEPPRSLRDRVTSLSQIIHQRLDQAKALTVVARHLHGMLLKNGERPFAQALSEYHRHHVLVGRQIAVVGGADEERLTGICRGLDSMGRLLLKTPAGTQKIIAGHVILLA